MNSYFIYTDGRFSLKTSKEILGDERYNSAKTRLWSARIGTGLFGLASCESGNRGPKNTQEVLLAAGDRGLEKLIDLGFITCPVCKPQESYDDFWDVIQHRVAKKYGVFTLEGFTDKSLIEYDALRLDWESIIPVTGGFPSRIYARPDMKALEIVVTAERIESLCNEFCNPRSMPQVGYLDKSRTPWAFVSYPI